MGLDISVYTKVSDVLEAIQFDDCGVKNRDRLRSLLKEQNATDSIHTRPGSYSGLHEVRVAYAKMKAWPTTDNDRYPKQGGAATDCHLISHSDCDGWYLPEDFPSPAFVRDGAASCISIGSSVRLLAELEEMESLRDANPDWGWRWDQVYIAAAASVVTRTPIEFG